MKIGLDAIEMVGGGGNATYSRNLIHHVLNQDFENTYYLFEYLHDLGRRAYIDPEINRKRYRTCHTYLSHLLVPSGYLEEINAFLLHGVSRACGMDIFHFTNPLNVTEVGARRVITLHDLAALVHPEWTKESTQKTFEKKLPLLKSSEHIIAVSQFTKHETVRLLNVSPEKIHVIHEAASREFYPDPCEEAQQSLTGGRPYILYLGQLQPRKNILTLIDAFALTARENREIVLVLAGSARDDAYKNQIYERIRMHHLEERVVLPGRVRNLRSLYSNAVCLAYVSLLEGFGLPVLEALQCGTPVVCSNSSSLPEVLGGGGILVDPLNPQEISAALSQISSDDIMRTQYSRAGILHAVQFSWERAAQETISVYRTL